MTVPLPEPITSGIPLATTRITVLRLDKPEDGYAEAVERTIATGVRADLYYNGGSTTRTETGTTLDTTHGLTCDPVDLQPNDIVLDETTGLRYHVEHAHTQQWLVASTIAGLERRGFV